MHDQHAIWATMQAVKGREQDARDFLAEAARRLGEEEGTTDFYALEIGDGKFAIFNIFRDAPSVQAHVTGRVAQWVKDSQPGLFTEPYDITRTDILTTKQREAASSESA